MVPCARELGVGGWRRTSATPRAPPAEMSPGVRRRSTAVLAPRIINYRTRAEEPQRRRFAGSLQARDKRARHPQARPRRARGRGIFAPRSLRRSLGPGSAALFPVQRRRRPRQYSPFAFRCAFSTRRGRPRAGSARGFTTFSEEGGGNSISLAAPEPATPLQLAFPRVLYGRRRTRS